MISKKDANYKANNPTISDYDPWLTYLDMNNLYANIPHPEKDFDWCTQEQIETFDVVDIPDDSKTAWICSGGWPKKNYPDNPHDYHSDLSFSRLSHGFYPLAPENKTITDEMLQYVS